MNPVSLAYLAIVCLPLVFLDRRVWPYPGRPSSTDFCFFSFRHFVQCWSKPDIGTNFVPAMPRNSRAKSCHFSGMKSKWRTTNGLRHGTQLGVPMRKNSWQCASECVGMWVEFQNVHVTVRIGTPCHSIVAPSLLTVYNLFTKWHNNFVVTSRGTLEKS